MTLQSVTNMFLTEYKYRILFGFQKSPNTKYQILFATKKIWIPNTKYYLVSRKSKYRIRIVLFSLTTQIPNTKYAIVYTILEKTSAKIKIFVSYKTYCLNYSDGYLDWYSNTRIIFRVSKKTNTEYQILFGIEIIRIINTNTTIPSNYSNSIQIPNYLSHPVTLNLSRCAKSSTNTKLDRNG